MSTTPGIKIVCTHQGCANRSVARRLCRAHYQQAWKAGELSTHEKLPPREPNPTICPPEHKHDGSLVCYNLHQCRCRPCSAHRMKAEERRRKDKAYGRYDTGLVDVAPVREHVLMLGEFGIGYKRVAQLAGFKSSTPVRTIIWGRQDPGARFGEMQKRVKRETAERILAVEPLLEYLGARQPVKAGPFVRRLKALVALGWSQSKIADALGFTRGNFRFIREYDRAGSHRHRVVMGAATARAIVALYDDWSNRQPPETNQRERIAASRARRYAREQGWPLPMDWEAVDNAFDRTVPVRRSAA